MSPADLIAYAADRGVRLRELGGRLRCLSVGPLPEDLRTILVARKAELLAHLGSPPPGGAEPWDGREARRLMEAADALVERLGVDGRHPAVAASAAAVASAYRVRDMETLQLAVAEFEVAVRRQAADRVRLCRGPLPDTTPMADAQ